MSKRLKGLSRRDVIVGALPTVLLGAGSTPVLGQSPSVEEAQRFAREYRAKAIADFPYRVVEAKGSEALATWQKLKATGDGIPVVVGDDEAFGMFAEFFAQAKDPRSNGPSRPQTVADILAAADRLKHPESIHDLRRDEGGVVSVPVARSGFALLLDSLTTFEPPVGSWPETPPPSSGLAVAFDWRTGGPFDKVKIVIVPTDDPTTIPAHLFWGNWNSCPPPEYHVAALRSWHDRYGAEVVGLSFDTMNLSVRQRPADREEALALSREHYAYCEDIVLQAEGSFSPLAASLLENDWWYFWWD
jgi:hypothetical protein